MCYINIISYDIMSNLSTPTMRKEPMQFLCTRNSACLDYADISRQNLSLNVVTKFVCLLPSPPNFCLPSQICLRKPLSDTPTILTDTCWGVGKNVLHSWHDVWKERIQFFRRKMSDYHITNDIQEKEHLCPVSPNQPFPSLKLVSLSNFSSNKFRTGRLTPELVEEKQKSERE